MVSSLALQRFGLVYEYFDKETFCARLEWSRVDYCYCYTIVCIPLGVLLLS